ncbi:MAG: phage holin family protein [Prevotella sp.]|nr:phage holin family protein [Prevotella sp.]
MFSNDQNIEYIAQFAEEAKQWFDLRVKYTKLSSVDKIVRIITALILVVVLSAIFTLALIFFSIALAVLLGKAMGSTILGFTCIGVVYILLFIAVYSARHALIEKPLVHFLMSIFAEDMNKEEV